MSGPDEVTGLLLDWSNGNPNALNALMPLVYDELRRIAARYLRQERRDHTLQTTALVHEAYLRLIDQRRARIEDRDHFFALSSQLVRRILVDHARADKAARRGGGVPPLELKEAAAMPQGRGVDLVLLDDALSSLAELDPQQSRIVELRFFGGLSIESTARVLGISPATVKRDWSTAKVWLYRELKDRGTGGRAKSSAM